MDEKTQEPTTDVEVSRGFAGIVQGENVKVTNAGVGLISAGNDASLRQGGATIIAARGNMQVMQGGGQILAAGANMSVMQGGGQLLASGGYMRVEQGGGLAMIAYRASIRRSYVGVLISGSTQLQEGAKVLLGTTQAAVLGAAFGLVFALVGRLLKGRG